MIARVLSGWTRARADHEAAVVAEEARRVLVRFDDRVVHYEVAAEI